MHNADKFSKFSVDFVQRLAKYSNYPLPSTVLFADILKASFGNSVGCQNNRPHVKSTPFYSEESTPILVNPVIGFNRCEWMMVLLLYNHYILIEYISPFLTMLLNYPISWFQSMPKFCNSV